MNLKCMLFGHRYPIVSVNELREPQEIAVLCTRCGKVREEWIYDAE